MVSSAKISVCTGQPEISAEIPILQKGNIKAFRPRILLGWGHLDDTLEGRCDGKIWCWVSEHDSLQIYDEPFNRSTRPGEYRKCGVANFTMVLMFHPYWKIDGGAPEDMNWDHKRECRNRWRALFEQHSRASGTAVDDDPEDDAQAPNSSKRGRGRPRFQVSRTSRRRFSTPRSPGAQSSSNISDIDDNSSDDSSDNEATEPFQKRQQRRRPSTWSSPSASPCSNRSTSRSVTPKSEHDSDNDVQLILTKTRSASRRVFTPGLNGIRQFPRLPTPVSRQRFASTPLNRPSYMFLSSNENSQATVNGVHQAQSSSLSVQQSPPNAETQAGRTNAANMNTGVDLPDLGSEPDWDSMQVNDTRANSAPIQSIESSQRFSASVAAQTLLTVAEGSRGGSVTLPVVDLTIETTDTSVVENTAEIDISQNSEAKSDTATFTGNSQDNISTDPVKIEWFGFREEWKFGADEVIELD